MDSRSRPSYAVPAVVFAFFGVGLALALAYGGYHDPNPADAQHPAATQSVKPAGHPTHE